MTSTNAGTGAWKNLAPCVPTDTVCCVTKHDNRLLTEGVGWGEQANLSAFVDECSWSVTVVGVFVCVCPSSHQMYTSFGQVFSITQIQAILWPYHLLHQTCRPYDSCKVIQAAAAWLFALSRQSENGRISYTWSFSTISVKFNYFSKIPLYGDTSSNWLNDFWIALTI